MPLSSRSSLNSAALVLLTTLTGCGGCDPPQRERPRAAAPTASASGPAAPVLPPSRTLVDVIRALPDCDIDHRGPLLDAGTSAMMGRFGWSEGKPAGLTSVEHDGSTWARVTDRKLTVNFTLTDASPIFVAARVVGNGAKSAQVLLDDQPLGTLNFAREQIKIATTGTTTLPVDAGIHTLTLRFFGKSRDQDSLADIDWIRVGIPDDNAATYGPPTLRDLVAPAAAIGGVPHRSLALRAPGSVRCAMRVPEGAILRASVGIQGIGDGDAEIRVLRDGKKPDTLRTLHLEAGDHATWTEVELPLAAYAREVIALELRATQAARGGRVLFGDPMVTVTAPPPPPAPAARAVVIVVLDGVERAELPPWSGAPTPNLPALTELATTATIFDQHRAPSPIVSAVVASLLTGLPPSTHGLTDPAARLPADLTTIAGVARDASVRTAMFTGVPHTFRGFGFAQAWERFVEYAPSSGDPATAPLDSAAAWVTEVAKASSESRLLTLIHARGGHPPWDMTLKEMSAAVPTDYTGMVEPRTAAQLISRLRRGKHAATNVNDADRQRIRSLEQIALAGQDRALGALIAALKTANLWDTTLLIVTGDASSGAGALFAEAGELKEPLSEPTLTLPLYVHFPTGIYAGKRVTQPTSVVDLANEALGALSLGFSKQSTGRDISRAAGGIDEGTPPQIASLDNRYSARWGTLVLDGRYPTAPDLCDLAVDPTCAFNRREKMPIAAAALFRSIIAEQVAARVPASKREPATIDQDTSAALSVWGAF
ncbi:MAG: sulfatase-like hydrolase/transferase [Byssovorax sp.]